MANIISSIKFGDTAYQIKAQSLDSSSATEGQIPVANSTGGITWTDSGVGVQSIGGQSGAITLGTGLSIDNQNVMKCEGVEYTTTAPDAASASGLKIAILSSAPSTYYSGWLYFILES